RIEFAVSNGEGDAGDGACLVGIAVAALDQIYDFERVIGFHYSLCARPHFRTDSFHRVAICVMVRAPKRMPEEYMADRVRTFLRGITSEAYSLDSFRREQRSVPRVRTYGTKTKSGHSGGSEHDSAWWVVGPGDDPFLTQT